MEVLQSLAASTGAELSDELRSMTRAERSDDMLPDHLMAQIGSGGGH